MKTRKRNTVLNSSADDEYDKSLLGSKRSYQKPKRKSLFTTRTSPRRPKRPRKESSHVDEMKLAMEEFDQVLNGFKVSTGCQSSESKELWVDKYKPRSLEELAVNKKKVEEVKKWFQDRLDNSNIDKHENCAIIISGPPGVGKSATVHAIASHLGARVCEWNTPTPTVWSEHIHNSNIGISYTSKLDEFELFVERVRKYGLISPSFPAQLESSVILLIDDIPVTHGRMAFERVKQILDLLVRSVQIPTAILFTDYGNEDSADHSACWLELQSSLERSGAYKVSFNPITHNSIKKTLSRICRQECCDLTAEQIDLISQGSGADIRQAISSLQLFCLKPYPMLNLSPSFKTNDEKKVNELNISNGGSLSFGRDETLTLFHALGKFLHNKRETKNIDASDSNPFSLQQKFSRFPIKMDSPEKILCQAHGQARTVTDFLHENVFDFLSDEAMDDAWDVASYLGDADVLLSFFSKFWARYNEVENVLQSAAASVGVRGVLYGNAHPASSRWHVIRKPKLWQIEQSSLRNQREIVSRRLGSENRLSLCEASVIATEFTPAMKWLGYRSSSECNSRRMTAQSDRNESNLEQMSLDQGESDISDDDDIEDC